MYNKNGAHGTCWAPSQGGRQPPIMVVWPRNAQQRLDTQQACRCYPRGRLPTVLSWQRTLPRPQQALERDCDGQPHWWFRCLPLVSSRGGLYPPNPRGVAPFPTAGAAHVGRVRAGGMETPMNIPSEEVRLRK